MTFPWKHQAVSAAKNMPFDIDEMPSILAQEDKSRNPFNNGPLGFGRFESGERKDGPFSPLVDPQDVICSAARRSDDPGIIEWRSLAKPPSPDDDAFEGQMNKMPLTTTRLDQSADDPVAFGIADHADTIVRGEISLLCFEEVQRRKRRKLYQSTHCTRQRLISVKVGSTSTRSTVLPCFRKTVQADVGSRKKLPSLILEATLPAEVHNGKVVSAAKAKSLIKELGSYYNTVKNSSRGAVGRTRLVWSEKNQSDQPQRASFTSLLTGEKIESGGQKRPREIRVSIKLNGTPVLRIGDLRKLSSSSLSFARGASGGVHQIRGEIMPGKHKRKLLCSLDTGKLVNKLLLDAAKTANNIVTTSFKSFSMVAPKIECLPDSSGLIGVVCSVPGRFSGESSVQTVWKDCARNPTLTCSICWSSSTASASVEECYTCGVTVHLGCCYDSGERIRLKSEEENSNSISSWRCAVCCKVGGGKDINSPADCGKSKKPAQLPQPIKDALSASAVLMSSEALQASVSLNPKCALCPHSGGAMSPFDLNGKTIWIHEICRIWCLGFGSLEGGSRVDLATTSLFKRAASCALCGTSIESVARSMSNESGASGVTSPYCLTKCAAARCQVHFHPMCARLASLLCKNNNSSSDRNMNVAGRGSVQDAISDSKNFDVYLCSQYTLTAAKCVAVQGANGRDPGFECFSSIPVAFCGIHNPRRDRSFFGMYPGGQHVDGSVVRIPPQDREAH